MKLFILVLFAVTGAATAPKPRTAEALSVELKGGSYIGILQEGFHFNEKAPNTVTVDGRSFKPTQLRARRIEFSGLPKSFTGGKAHLYVCDDALTYCEPRTFELGGPSAAEKTPRALPPPKSGAAGKHGFIEEDLPGAVAKAKQSGRLVLVDFSARWCPGCMRLESETFPTKEFSDLTKNMVKVKIDVDRFENLVLAERFKIQGIPTLLVLNAFQEEIDRLYDYQPLPTLALFFKSVTAEPSPLKELEKRAAGNDRAAAHLLGKRLAMAGRFDDALRHLSRLSPRPPEYWTAKIGAMSDRFKKDPSIKGEFAKVLKEAIAAEGASSRSIAWRTELVSLLENKTEIEQTVADGVKIADRLLADPGARQEAMKTDLIGEFTGYEPLMIGLAKVDLLDAGRAEPEILKAAWARASEIGEQLGITAATPGPAIRHLSTLIKSGKLDKADRLSRGLLKKDPSNPEIQRRRMRVLLEMKRYAEAIKIGESGLKNSYGRNEYWVAESLAKAYVGAKRKREALALLDAYLARRDIDWPNMGGSKKSMEELRSAAKGQEP